jgi:hypothetical protein
MRKRDTKLAPPKFKRRPKMTRIVSLPVSLELFKEAVEYYWRSQTIIKAHEDVDIVVPSADAFPMLLQVKLEEDKGVESKLEHGAELPKRKRVGKLA